MKKIMERIRAMNAIGRVKVRIRRNKNNTFSIFLDHWDGVKHNYGYRIRISAAGDRMDWERFKIFMAKWDKADKQLVEKGAGIVPKSDVVFRDFVQSVFEKKQLSEETVYNYRTALRTPVKHLGDMLVSEIQPQHIESIPWSYTPNTVHQYLVILRTFFNIALKEDIIIKNPVRVRPHHTEHKKKVFLTPAEIKKVAALKLKGTWHQAQEAFLFSFNTGMRFKDVTSITDENLRDGYVYYRISKSRRTSPRDTRKWLNRTAASLVKGKTGVLFPLTRAMGHLRLPQIAKLAGVRRFTFHTAKRSLAQTLMEMDIDPYIRSVILDHKLGGISPVYLHPFSKKVDEALKALEEV